MVVRWISCLLAPFRQCPASRRQCRMRRDGVEGGGRCMAMPTLRTVVLLTITTISLLVLYWMIKDQNTVRMCNDFLKGQGSTRISKWDYNWDFKAFKNPTDAQGVGVRSILLVRHGNYDLNTGHLTELGRMQANLTGLRLKALNMKYKVIIHSTMPRAMQTARILQTHLTDLRLVPDDAIQEGGPVPPDPTVSYWQLPDRTYFTDGPRLEAAFRKYFYRADPAQREQTFEILVGHANIFKFFTLRALQLPADAWMRVFIAHGSIILIHINPDGTVNMSRFGDSGHFPPKMVTY